MAVDSALTRRVNPLKQRLLGRFVRHWLPATETVVDLTFDDGPDPNFTPLVLERLAKHGVRATFFVLGRNVLRHRSTLRAVHAAGHRIGNHSLTHPDASFFDYWSVCEEIRYCQHAIEDAIGVTPTEFRPPFGRITPAVWLAARNAGLKLVNWSLDTGDWQCRTVEEAEQCAAETLSSVQSRDVVLLHDNHKWIGPILDRLLPGLAERGLL